MPFAIVQRCIEARTLSSTEFTGPPVSGDVNYTLNGDWYAGRINTFVNSSNVAGDLNAELKSGYIGCGNSNDSSKAFVYGNTNNKICNINVDRLQKVS